MDAIWNYHTKKILRRGTKKEPPPSEDGSSSRLLLHHPALIAGASARLWMPDSVLHTLPRTGEGRFSLVIGSHTPSDYADMPKAPVISYSAPSPMGHFRTLPHAICRRREGCEPYILRVCSWHFPPSGNPRSTPVHFR